MPLLDHFRPPLFPLHRWESFHGQWAAMLVQHLNDDVLPERYYAAPYVSLSGGLEVDVGASDTNGAAPVSGGVAVLPYAPPKARLCSPIEFTNLDSIEVQVLEQGTARLVSAIELVSPANKDRPANRAAFSMKCAGILTGGASVTVIDLVGERRGNFIQEIFDLFGCRPDAKDIPDPLYVAAFRMVKSSADQFHLESWPEGLAMGQPLPTLPLWLGKDEVAPLDLEGTYVRTCQVLRIDG